MSATTPPIWSSDTRISIPEPSPHPVVVPMYGFGFSQYGICHDLTDVEYEAMRTPTYRPDFTDDVVRDDLDVE